MTTPDPRGRLRDRIRLADVLWGVFVLPVAVAVCAVLASVEDEAGTP